jgi:hypothetical protein
MIWTPPTADQLLAMTVCADLRGLADTVGATRACSGGIRQEGSDDSHAVNDRVATRYTEQGRRRRLRGSTRRRRNPALIDEALSL